MTHVYLYGKANKRSIYRYMFGRGLDIMNLKPKKGLLDGFFPTCKGWSLVRDIFDTSAIACRGDGGRMHKERLNKLVCYWKDQQSVLHSWVENLQGCI